jgi:HTH-type transcriptional regulator/antitoxin HigA
MSKVLRPNRAISPGEILEDQLRCLGWSQLELAIVLGRPVQVVSEIIARKKAITPETAVALSRALGPSAEFWLNLEARYRLDLLAREQVTRTSDVYLRAQLFKKTPVKELIKRGWINADLENLDATKKAVCRFLRIKALEDDVQLRFAARKTDRDQPPTAAQQAWACRVRNVAERRPAAPYDKRGLEEVIRRLPPLSRAEQDTRRVPSILASVGVRFVIVEHLPGTHIDGGTLWMDDPPAHMQPVIGLSFRYDRVDWFWFTLLHELMHVLEEDQALDAQLVGNDATSADISENERRADQAATEALVDQKQLRAFVASIKPYFSRSAIEEFAKRVNVHPAIVVGQLQKRGDVPYSHHRNLLARVKHVFE